MKYLVVKCIFLNKFIDLRLKIWYNLNVLIDLPSVNIQNLVR